MRGDPGDQLAAYRKLREENLQLARENEALKGGDGGGTSNGMEGRVARLEAHVDTLRGDVATMKSDVGKIRVDLATLTERVAHLPGKGFVITATTTTVGFLTAVIVFGDKIKGLLGLG